MLGKNSFKRLINQALAACLLLSALGDAIAAESSARYSTGYLVQLYRGETLLAPLPPGADSAAARATAKQAAIAYISGVIDTAEGVRWCVNRSAIPPRELDEQLIEVLFKSTKQQSNAAHALAAELSKRFTCRKASKK
jgi:hypothetical protein